MYIYLESHTMSSSSREQATCPHVLCPSSRPFVPFMAKLLFEGNYVIISHDWAGAAASKSLSKLSLESA